jgi:hypothetical protein
MFHKSSNDKMSVALALAIYKAKTYILSHIERINQAKLAFENGSSPVIPKMYDEDPNRYKGILELCTRFSDLWNLVNSKGEGFNGTSTPCFRALLDFLTWFLQWRKDSFDRARLAVVQLYNTKESARIAAILPAPVLEPSASKNAVKKAGKTFQPHSGKFSDPQLHGLFLSSQVTHDIIRNISSMIQMYVYWPNKSRLEQLRDSDQPYGFGPRAPSARGLSSNMDMGDASVPSMEMDEVVGGGQLFEYSNDSKVGAFMMPHAMLSDACEHSFADLRRRLAKKAQTPLIVIQAVHNSNAQTLHSGSERTLSDADSRRLEQLNGGNSIIVANSNDPQDSNVRNLSLRDVASYRKKI